jgi:hypothetical protein
LNCLEEGFLSALIDFCKDPRTSSGRDPGDREHAIMEERLGEAFAGTEQLTVMSRHLHAGEPAPDFCLDYLDLLDIE